MRQGSNRHQPAGEEDRALPSFNRLKDISADRPYRFKRSQMAHMSSPALFVGGEAVLQMPRVVGS